MRNTALCGLVIGCTPAASDGDTGAPADIEVSPLSIQFPGLVPGASDTRSFSITNGGDDSLDVDDLVLEGEAFALSQVAGTTLAPGEAVYIDVTYTAGTTGTIGSVTVNSTDEDERTIVVALSGDADVPDIAFEPAFPEVSAFVPCDGVEGVGLRNDGGSDLVVDSILWEGDPAITFNGLPPLPLTLAAGDSANFELWLDGSTEGNSEGSIRLISNDPEGDLVVSVTGDTSYATTVTDSFLVPADAAVDIIVLVDTSPSMGLSSAELGAEFSDFIMVINAVTAGWRLGVVNSLDGCFNQGVLSPDVPDYQELFNTAVTTFEPHILQESLLLLADVALEDTGPGLCNDQFLRLGGLLHIIVVSDERDLSPGYWLNWVEGYRQYVAAPELLTVSGVVNVYNTCGSLNGASGYLEAIAETGGVTLDICDSGWGSQIDQLADASLQALTHYPLSDLPDPQSLVVRVDGVGVTSGWIYDEVENEVVFEEVLFDGGELIEITFGVPSACE